MADAAKKRFIVLDVVPPNVVKVEAEKNLQEMMSLIDTYGGATVVQIIQRRATPDGHTYIGKGKAQEVTDIVAEQKIDVVVLNDVVKSGQLFNLTQMFWKVNHQIEVWDRVDLILHIFDKQAHTAEAKLQIELAKMRHMGPRIFGLGGTVLSRQGGGIGTRGLGETNTELMKRHWRGEMKKVEVELNRLAQERQRQIDRRKEVGLQTVSIVGYTNAGKSTLFNLLTKKKKKAADVLFATLDATVGKVWVQGLNREILFSDTIGFIQNLPPKLIQAFKSTLMEAQDAELLLHVIDASDPKMDEKMMVVEDILEQLHMLDKKVIYVFNKIDMLSKPEIVALLERFDEKDPVFISAEDLVGLDYLMEQIQEALHN